MSVSTNDSVERFYMTMSYRQLAAMVAALAFSAPTVLAQQPAPEIQRLSADDFTGSVFEHADTQRLPEVSEAGETEALDRVWHESDDGCLQTGIYQTGPNRYTITDPYPYDELMMFFEGGVTLTPTDGAAVKVVAGDTVLLPKGWTGVWHSDGYRKMYVIYNCPEQDSVTSR